MYINFYCVVFVGGGINRRWVLSKVTHREHRDQKCKILIAQNNGLHLESARKIPNEMRNFYRYIELLAEIVFLMY